jgi:photosystem II stability/assembly factor-like uncharacterized protein
MRRIFVWAAIPLLLLGAVAPAGADPQGSWTLQAPQPTMWDLYGVDMVSALEGWAVGESGTILHTSDGGRSWAPQQSSAGEGLWGVRFIDGSHGWAVGNGAWYTTDGGLNWLKGQGPQGSLYAVDFVDVSNGWAVGNGGQLWKTTNGGKNWTWLDTTGTNENLLALDFVTRSRGWIVGIDGTILRTTNGGSSWQKQPNGSAQYLAGVSFISATEGWAGGGNVVLHTTDGGQTWEEQDFPITSSINAIDFADPLHGWAVGEGEILATDDGGDTWEGEVHVGDRLWAVEALSASSGFVVGWGPAVLTTVDGGTTWENQVNGPVTIGYAVATTDLDHAWVAEAFGQIARTQNGGQDWDRVLIGNPYGHFWGIDFATDSVGWVVGDGDQSANYGVVYRSGDGGVTWELQLATGSLDIVYDVAAISPRRAVVVSALGYIRYTLDGGLSWLDAERPSGSLLSAVEFDGRIGWAAGNQATVERSTDGGRTWVDRSPPSPIDSALMDVSFADANTGWAVGFYGEVWRTTDAGLTWRSQHVEGASDVNFLAVEAISPTTAWIAGGPADGFLARTTNGGATWTREVLPSDEQVYAVSGLSFVNAEQGYAAGHVGIWRRG